MLIENSENDPVETRHGAKVIEEAEEEEENSIGRVPGF